MKTDKINAIKQRIESAFLHLALTPLPYSHKHLFAVPNLAKG